MCGASRGFQWGCLLLVRLVAASPAGLFVPADVNVSSSSAAVHNRAPLDATNSVDHAASQNFTSQVDVVYAREVERQVIVALVRMVFDHPSPVYGVHVRVATRGKLVRTYPRLENYSRIGRHPWLLRAQTGSIRSCADDPMVAINTDASSNGFTGLALGMYYVQPIDVPCTVFIALDTMKACPIGRSGVFAYSNQSDTQTATVDASVPLKTMTSASCGVDDESPGGRSWVDPTLYLMLSGMILLGGLGLCSTRGHVVRGIGATT